MPSKSALSAPVNPAIPVLPDFGLDEKITAELQTILYPVPLDLEIPEELCCPITGMLLRDPVSTSDGQTYEREAIEAWLENNNTSPLAGHEPLENKKLTPIVFVRNSVHRFVNEHPALKNSKEWYLPKAWIHELAEACQEGNAEAIRALVNRDPRLLVHTFREGPYQGKTALYLAAMGHPRALETIVCLLEKRASSLGAVAVLQANTLLYNPAQEGAREESSMLQGQGAGGLFFLRQQRVIEEQARKLEEQAQHIEVLKRQYAASDVAVSEAAQHAAFALERDRKAASLAAVQNPALQDALIQACEEGDIAQVKGLLQQGASPAQTGSTGKRPLGAAVWGMNPEVVHALLEEVKGESSLTWEECKVHNQRYYKEVFMFTTFHPFDYAEWSELLDKMGRSRYLRNLHLGIATATWYNDDDDTAALWENFASWEGFALHMYKKGIDDDGSKERGYGWICLKTREKLEGLITDIEKQVNCASAWHKLAR